MASTEIVLLLFMYVAIFGGLMFGTDSSMFGSFKEGTPKLAAKVERNLMTGHRFTVDGDYNEWQ